MDWPHINPAGDPLYHPGDLDPGSRSEAPVSFVRPTR